jgi:hypothetical protein
VLLQTSLEELQLVIMPCREPLDPQIHDSYNSAYQLWHKVWSETLNELDGVNKLFSNEFTRNDFVMAILSNKKAISLACYTAVDLKLDTRKNDSWFECWPKELLDDPARRPGLGVFASWFTVASEFRKRQSHSEINIAQIMVEGFGKIVLEDGYNVGFGTSRNNRGVNKMLYNIGATKHGEAISHGCDVDLILIEPSHVNRNQTHYSKEFKHLWERRIDYRRIENEYKLSKSA